MKLKHELRIVIATDENLVPLGGTPEIDFSGLDRAIRPGFAEFIDYLVLRAADASAKHLGGNFAVRDHELLENTAWSNTKICWFDELGRVGFGPVNWGKAAASPETTLDLVSLVALRPGDLQISMTGKRSVMVTWPEVEHFVVPAAVLRSVSRVESEARASAPLSALDRYFVTADHPLTRDRLHALIAEHAEKS